MGAKILKQMNQTLCQICGRKKFAKKLVTASAESGRSDCAVAILGRRYSEWGGSGHSYRADPHRTKPRPA